MTFTKKKYLIIASCIYMHCYFKAFLLYVVGFWSDCVGDIQPRSNALPWHEPGRSGWIPWRGIKIEQTHQYSLFWGNVSNVCRHWWMSVHSIPVCVYWVMYWLLCQWSTSVVSGLRDCYHHSVTCAIGHVALNQWHYHHFNTAIYLKRHLKSIGK